MQNVEIEIFERRAKVAGAPVLVCGNTGDTITFTFDDEWEDTENKTARFVYEENGKICYQDVEFIGTVVEIPPFSDIRSVKVGVFAGTLTTTTAAVIHYEASILSASGQEDKNLFEAGQNSVIDTCSPAIVITSDTAKALTVNDSSESVIKGLTAYGESTQDGTPTPDNPVEIESIENPTISIYGKNLCPVSNAVFSFTQVTYYDLPLENLKVSDIQGVTLTLSVKQGYDDLQIGFGASGQTTDGNGYWYQYPAKGARTFTFTIPADYFTAPQTVTPRVRFHRSAGVSAQEYSISEIQLEIGSVATPYQPYIKPQTITIPYTFRGLKNSSGDWVARDELRVGDGKVEIVRNVGYLDCTSDLNWVKSSVTKSDLYSYENSELFGTSTNSTAFPKCTHFIAQWDTVVGHFYIAGGRAYFSYAEYGTTTLEDWKSFLDTANMYIIWASYKSTIEDITATEAGQAMLALKSNYPSTSVISDIGLNITYKADTKNYIDNKIAALTALTLEG